MTLPTDIDIRAWIDDILTGAGGLEAFQAHEYAVEQAPRDVVVAAWVLRCLANPRCAGSAEVFREIYVMRVKRSLPEEDRG